MKKHTEESKQGAVRIALTSGLGATDIASKLGIARARVCRALKDEPSTVT